MEKHCSRQKTNESSNINKFNLAQILHLRNSCGFTVANPVRTPNGNGFYN